MRELNQVTMAILAGREWVNFAIITLCEQLGVLNWKRLSITRKRRSFQIEISSGLRFPIHHRLFNAQENEIPPTLLDIKQTM
jgi:hypothetical protein